MFEVSGVERGTRIGLRGTTDSVFCTRPKVPALGKPKFLSKSLYPPLHMLAPGRRARGLSAIDLRHLSGAERHGFVREVSGHLVAHDEMAHSSGCTGIRLC